MLSHVAFCFIRDPTFPVLPRYNNVGVGEWSSHVLYLCFWATSFSRIPACAIGIVLIVNTLEGTFSSPAFLSR